MNLSQQVIEAASDRLVKEFDAKLLQKIKTPSDVYELLSLHDIENESIKISAKAQKAMFGYNAIGRQTIRFMPDTDQVRVSKSIAFGQDSSSSTMSTQEFVDRINQKKDLKVNW